MSLELIRPWALALLVVCLPILVAIFVHGLSSFPKKQRIVSTVVRSLIVLLIVLSLAGLTLLLETQRQYVLFIIDRSLSIGKEAASTVETKLDEALQHQGSHRVGFLEFTEIPDVVREFRPQVTSAVPSTALTRSKNSGAPVADSHDHRIQKDDSARPAVKALAVPPKQVSPNAGTNIAAAIEAAAAHIPPGYVPKLVLLSEGNQTLGDAVSASIQCGIPIDVYPLPTRREQEVLVSEVRVPAEVRQGEPFFVEVIIHSNHDDEGLIEVYQADHKVVSERRSIKAGENSFRFRQSVDRERLADFTVRISELGQDTLLDNNSDFGLVYAAGNPRILIIESDPNLIRELAYGLEDEGIRTDVRPPQGMPDSLSDLQNYELLILSNVPATSLTQKQMQIVRTFVQELGGGFIMLGGEQSFGLGGYYKSTIEEILPVRSDFEKEKEKPSLAMVLSIDKSGSMSGEKIEMAKSAARSAVELLGLRDQVAVLAFDGETFVISKMQSASAKSTIDRNIARINAGGGTSMHPAMETAYEMLQSTSAKLKHVILLTDGVSSPGDFEGIAQTMVSARITLSTVAVGDGADTQLLEAIARIGKGRYYFTADPEQVPQIFAKETVTAGKSAIDEQPFLPLVIRATHALKDLDMDAAPFLLGYVVTRPKPTSEVILATETRDPLLSWWRYGLGMSAAFTSDAKNRWAAEWVTWPGFSKFWTQVVRQVMRKGDDRGIAVEIERRGRDVRLTLDATDDIGRFVNDAQVELTIIDPLLHRSRLVLPQDAPGRYATTFPTGPSGAYHMEMAVKKHDQVVYRQSRGLTVGYSDELRIRPTNESLLKNIARHSGGTYNPSTEAAFVGDSRRVTRPTALWPWLLTTAMGLLVLDVALRRIDFSLHWPFSRV
ncbi:MAG: VWA domain-containing protein [Fuerstiella sp.]|nr:VWA domain-containing protein [Fuerstiella sp.]